MDPSKKAADASLPSVPTVVPTFPAVAVEEDEEADSQPINFDTFVPTHDTTQHSTTKDTTYPTAFAAAAALAVAVTISSVFPRSVSVVTPGNSDVAVTGFGASASPASGS